MWVAGTLGAYFTALARNLPLHAQQWSWPPDIPYTLDLFIRYGYVAWLLTYFFVSNLDNTPDEAPRNKDIAFDVLQSVAALWAIFWIGFALPGRGYGHEAFGPMLVVVNLAVALICLVSLICFAGESKWKKNVSRVAGLGISGGTLAVVIFGIKGNALLGCGIGAMILLLLTLAWYIRIRHA